VQLLAQQLALVQQLQEQAQRLVPEPE